MSDGTSNNNNDSSLSESSSQASPAPQGKNYDSMAIQKHFEVKRQVEDYKRTAANQP